MKDGIIIQFKLEIDGKKFNFKNIQNFKSIYICYIFLILMSYNLLFAKIFNKIDVYVL